MLRLTPGRAAALGWTLCAALALPPQASAQSSERESLEALRDTTLQLIELLVQSGSLTRAKADELLAQARLRAGSAAAKPAEPAGWGKPVAGAASVVRVPYVPQVVRDQIRDELKEEVLNVAREERWGLPGRALPEWLNRVSVSGDLRVRQQNDRYLDSNLSPEQFLNAALSSGLTRAPDLAAGTAGGLATANTQDNRQRLRVRARLGADVKIDQEFTGGIRLTTGSATDRVSTNQTLGNNFNRYTLLLERAYLRWTPRDWLRVSAGRIANPFFSTDLVWDEDISFDGFTGTAYLPGYSPITDEPWQFYATGGYFPVREQSPPRSSRYIGAVQLGMQYERALKRYRVGLAYYDFHNFEGRVDKDYDPITGAGRSYGQYEYEASLRQRGNTLFLTNSPFEIQNGLSIDRARWGLASRFRSVALTAAADFEQFVPYALKIEGELVRNQAYDAEEVAARSGTRFYDARTFGVGLKTTFGTRLLTEPGDWQASLALRWLGGDALPDAFVDSDLALGGTNVKGYVLGFDYAFARDGILGMRYLSGRNIESVTARGWLDDRFGADTLQVNVNVRF